MNTGLLAVPLALPMLLLAATSVNPAPSASQGECAPQRTAAGLSLIWHVEAPDGAVLDSRCGDAPINPASLVKAATTLWALERLGPDHRFETRFAARGTLDLALGRLDGDLLVLGGGDPDFQPENGFLVAERLNELGLRTVTGSLLVSDDFWIGWEQEAERNEPDPAVRARRMATRLRDTLDAQRWTRTTRRIWNELNVRRGRTAAAPSVTIGAGIGRIGDLPPDRILVTHRSNPLPWTLKRFNTFSNNDIARLGQTLGPPADLAAFLARRWRLPVTSIQFETLSGLGTNRLSPRLLVRLLQELERTCTRVGITLADVLPVAGCGASTLNLLPGVVRGGAERALIAKTGTLTETDGGVVALAGRVSTARGERMFTVAVPHCGWRTQQARQAEAQWLLRLLTREGGGRPQQCPTAAGHSDDGALVSIIEDLPRAATRP